MKIAVVCWDLGHNALGRAYVLADLLAAEHHVDIVGSHFPEFGAEVWPPLGDALAASGPFSRGKIGLRRHAGGRFPEYLQTLERMAADISADLVYVVKPRLPALGVGLFAKGDGERPLVVDCDDLELAFVAAASGLTLGELAGFRNHPDFVRPEGKIWTRFSDWAVRFADAVTVASVPLAARYRATVIPHARDEVVFDPARYDRDEARARVGLTARERVILFAGTARQHKGVDRIVAALDRIGDDRNRLLVLATPEFHEVAPRLTGVQQWVQLVPPQAFSTLPWLLRAADAVCVLQDERSESAQWQMPAKVTDALAMGVPCLATPTPPLLGLIDEGGVTGVDDGSLVDQLQRLLNDPVSRSEQAERGRELFLHRFSYSAVRPRLERVVRMAVDGPASPSTDLVSSVSFLRSSFAQPAATGHRQTSDRAAEEGASVRATVESVLAAGAGPIAVVSRGDNDLVRFEGHVGWHFPDDGAGRYAGHYPADSDAAIRLLEDVRRRGARYFVVPDSSAWWLDHYVGFREYLAATYRQMDAGAGVRTVVDLRPASDGGS